MRNVFISKYENIKSYVITCHYKILNYLYFSYIVIKLLDICCCECNKISIIFNVLNLSRNVFILESVKFYTIINELNIVFLHLVCNVNQYLCKWIRQNFWYFYLLNILNVYVWMCWKNVFILDILSIKCYIIFNKIKIVLIFIKNFPNYCFSKKIKILKLTNFRTFRSKLNLTFR